MTLAFTAQFPLHLYNTYIVRTCDRILCCFLLFFFKLENVPLTCQRHPLRLSAILPSVQTLFISNMRHLNRPIVTAQAMNEYFQCHELFWKDRRQPGEPAEWRELSTKNAKEGPRKPSLCLVPRLVFQST